MRPADGRARRRRRLLAVCAVLLSPALAGGQVEPEGGGQLVIDGARDPQQHYRWLAEGADGAAILSWPGGFLALPRSAAVDSLGEQALAVFYSERLRGFSAGRRLLFQQGRFAIKQPLLLSDGVLQLFAARGELTIEPGRLVYRDRPEASPPDRFPPRAQLTLLAGIVILIAVLLRLSRSRLRRP